MAHAGKPVRHEILLRAVWGPEFGNEREYLRVIINQLRKKIEEDSSEPAYILTESHIGYRFRGKIASAVWHGFAYGVRRCREVFIVTSVASLILLTGGELKSREDRDKRFVFQVAPERSGWK